MGWKVPITAAQTNPHHMSENTAPQESEMPANLAVTSSLPSWGNSMKGETRRVIFECCITTYATKKSSSLESQAWSLGVTKCVGVCRNVQKEPALSLHIDSTYIVGSLPLSVFNVIFSPHHAGLHSHSHTRTFFFKFPEEVVT